MVAIELLQAGDDANVQLVKGYPLVGVLPDVWKDPLGYFTELSRAGGDLIRLQIGPQRILFLNHPDHVKHVLQDRHEVYRKSDFYEALRPLFGNGLLLAEGDGWLRQRRVALPAFQGTCLRGIVPAMDEAIDDMLVRWQDYHNRGEAFDINKEMTRLTLDVLLRTLFGATAAGVFQAVYSGLTTALRHAERRVWSLVPVPSWLPTRENREAKLALRQLDEVVEWLIDERRGRPKATNDLLDLLLQAYENDRGLLRDEVVSMVMAGHETTANALTWTWLTLAERPDIAQKIRSEVGLDNGQPRDLSSIGHLSYTRAVIEEVMRLHPPVWTISRTALIDDDIGGARVPSGGTVMLCAYALHRNPRFWQQPDAFMPERFTEGSGCHERYAYFPFGGGPRICLGMRFAMTEAVLAVARVLHRYNLEIAPGQRIEPEPMITLRPKGQVMMLLKEVSRSSTADRSVSSIDQESPPRRQLAY